jgi:hypothetical protein
MLRLILPILLLAGCSDYEQTSQTSDMQEKWDTLRPQSGTETTKQRRPELFNNKRAFQVQIIGNRIETHTTDKDTAKCAKWTLTPNQIVTVIKNAEPIDGTVWDLSFDFLSCSVHGTIAQNGSEYPFTVNAGSFILVNSGDTTIIYGDYKKEDRRHFLSSPQM